MFDVQLDRLIRPVKSNSLKVRGINNNFLTTLKTKWKFQVKFFIFQFRTEHRSPSKWHLFTFITLLPAKNKKKICQFWVSLWLFFYTSTCRSNYWFVKQIAIKIISISKFERERGRKKSSKNEAKRRQHRSVGSMSAYNPKIFGLNLGAANIIFLKSCYKFNFIIG